MNRRMTQLAEARLALETAKAEFDAAGRTIAALTKSHSRPLPPNQVAHRLRLKHTARQLTEAEVARFIETVESVLPKSFSCTHEKGDQFVIECEKIDIGSAIKLIILDRAITNARNSLTARNQKLIAR